MDSLLIILLVVLIGISLVILYFQLKAKPKQEEDISDKIKEDINSLRTSFSDSFGSMSKEIAKDMAGALTKVDEKVLNFNQQVETLNKSQEGISKILAGVKKYGTLAEFSLGSLLQDLLPASQYISNVKMKEDTSENVEFAIKLQDGVLVPVDSHFPIEKFKAIDDAYQADDKKAAADARTKLARAFRDKAKSVNEKYIVPPKSTDFAIVYAPTESLFSELTSYQDPSTKELLTQELMRKYKIVILGPNIIILYFLISSWVNNSLVLGSWYEVNSENKLSVGAYTIAKSTVFGGTIYFSFTLLALALKALANFVLASAAAFLSFA